MSSLEQFMVFKEVVETGNITLASKRLHISQPSVSVQIQNLEREYGAELFERTNRGVTLTEPGNILYEKIVFVIHAMQQAKETINDYSAKQNTCIRMGATLTIGEYLLPHLMGLAHPDHLTPRFNLQVANTSIITKEVLEKNLNIGFVEGPPPHDNDLIIEKFWSDELVLVVPMNHPWSTRIEVSFDELASERFITRERGSGTRDVMELALLHSNFDPDQLNVVMELNSTQAIKEAVLSDLGVTIISALTIQEECRQKRLSMLRISGCSLKRPLSIITNRKVTLTVEERWFMNQMRHEDVLRSVIPEPFLPYSTSHTDAGKDQPCAIEHATTCPIAHTALDDGDNPDRLTFRGSSPRFPDLTETEQAIYSLIHDNGSLNSASVAITLKTTQRNGLIVLNSLINKGIIEGYGGSKNRRYRLRSQPSHKTRGRG
ncbi:LysR family transcriptional regulator [Gordonibacter sp.]|uniref:LysR family transcriptional regulator n=1 Tax=Gordonibacter sp. TaxID=1968902 RepID=UPI002FC9AFED